MLNILPQHIKRQNFIIYLLAQSTFIQGFPGGVVVKNPPANAGTTGDLGWEDALEEGMATHSSILPWRIPGTEEPGGLQSKGSQSRPQLIY